MKDKKVELVKQFLDKEHKKQLELEKQRLLKQIDWLHRELEAVRESYGLFQKYVLIMLIFCVVIAWLNAFN